MKVSLQKCDPYLNVDPGHHEPVPARRGLRDRGRRRDRPRPRATTSASPTRASPASPTSPPARCTTRSSRRSAAATSSGATVQVIPHVTDEIKARIRQAAASSNAEVVIVEIGGTVGDIESLPVPRGHPAAPQRRRPRARLLRPRHAGAVPRRLGRAQDQDHPALGQRAAAHRYRAGRARAALEPRRSPTTSARRSPSTAASRLNAVISAVDAGDIYEVPLNLEAEGFAQVVCQRLGRADAAARPHRLAPPGRRASAPARAGCASPWSASTSSSTTPTSRWRRP